MAETHPSLMTFNRGIVSRLGLARTDLRRLALSAEQQDNWIPRSLGSMTLRPGLQMLGKPQGNQAAVYLPFVSSTDPNVSDGTELLEFTPNILRIWQNDALVTRVAVATAVTNGTFSGSLTGWTNSDTGGGVSEWIAGDIMQLVGDGQNCAREGQSLSVAGGDIGKVHALRVVVTFGKVLIRLGTLDNDDDLLNETTLGVGTHSLAFVPTGSTAVIEIYNFQDSIAWVKSVQIEAAGILTLPTIFTAAQNKLIRIDQSANVVYLAIDGCPQYKIEHRKLPSDSSWSIVLYQPEDGPFNIINITPTTLTAGALSGNTTLTSSSPGIFRAGHVGALFRLASAGQTVTQSISAQNTFTDPIEVTGVGASRAISITISGTFVAFNTLQRSLQSTGPWTDVPGEGTGSTGTINYNDGLDNQILYYRLGVKTGDYTSGTSVSTLVYSSGSISGICRVVEFSSETEVSVTVLQNFGDTAATADWWEGIWSDLRGYPTSVVLDEGRLCWGGRGSITGSVSDAYESFDDTITGDSAPIIRTIGSGPNDVITWMVSLLELILGAQGAEWSARSDAIGTALTALNINLKDFSTQGSAPVAAMKIDKTAIFVQKSGNRIYLIELDNVYLGIYKSTDLTILIPDFGIKHGGFAKIAAQRSPDTRLHFLMNDGTVGILIFDPAEDLKCWVTASLRDGDVIEDVVTLPGQIEDRVYYQTARQVNGVTQRFLERWAREDECLAGLPVPKLADCAILYSGSPQTTFPVSHLQGEQVVVFADGKDQGMFTVNGSGNVILSVAVSNAIIGLPYDAHFQSAKLAYGAQLGSPLNQMKIIKRIGLVLTDSHARGLKYGDDFDHLDDMPPIEDGAPVDPDAYWSDYDKDQFALDGGWSTDSRLCLYAAAPRPVTVEAVSIEMETNE